MTVEGHRSSHHGAVARDDARQHNGDAFNNSHYDGGIHHHYHGQSAVLEPKPAQLLQDPGSPAAYNNGAVSQTECLKALQILQAVAEISCHLDYGHQAVSLARVIRDSGQSEDWQQQELKPITATLLERQDAVLEVRRMLWRSESKSRPDAVQLASLVHELLEDLSLVLERIFWKARSGFFSRLNTKYPWLKLDTCKEKLDNATYRLVRQTRAFVRSVRWHAMVGAF